MRCGRSLATFPFLFGGTFIEAVLGSVQVGVIIPGFPFLFGGTFIEAASRSSRRTVPCDFPSFSEGLSLRPVLSLMRSVMLWIFPFLFGGTFIEARGGEGGQMRG